MMKDASEKTWKKATQLTRQSLSGVPIQPRAIVGTSSNERTASPPADTTYTHPGLINTVWEGQNFLENWLLLVLEGALSDLSAGQDTQRGSTGYTFSSLVVG